MARHTLKSPAHETLTLQEGVLATAMLHKVGNATVQYALRGGERLYRPGQHLDENNFSQLVTEFSRDPKESLAWGRESLMAISRDKRLSEQEKSARLDRYLDAYTDLTLKLDHEAFPPSERVQVGVPDYIPDGFVDMGSDSSTDVNARLREMVKVDKEAIFDRYKPLLKNVFSRNYEGRTSTEKKAAMLEALTWGVYKEINYNGSHADQMRGVVNLGEVSEGVCRHIALTLQVLAQATGLTSKLLKCDVSLEETGLNRTNRHAANMVRINSDWYLLDVTNPDYVNKNGALEGRLGAMPINGPPQRGKERVYQGKMKHSGKRRKYVSHNDAYWFIAHPQ